MRDILRNPELVRHLRAEMRPPRMFLAGGIATVICFLISMAHSQLMVNLPTSQPPSVGRSLFVWLAVIQSIVLVMWAFSASIQAIASERQMKTYDFVRTTRLTSLELLLGYLFGVPIMAYFTVAVTAVFAIVAGLGVGLPFTAMVATYILVFVFTVFASLFGLMISMLLEKPRAAGTLFVVWFLAWPLSIMGMAFGGSPFPGLSALAIVPSVAPMFVPDSIVPPSAPFFGLPVPLFLMTILLYGSFGGWIVVALLRNLKKEREEIQLLTRTQALIFTAFINLLFLGLYNRDFKPGYANAFRDTIAITAIFIFMNQGLLYIVGLSTLSPAERLKVWYREFKAGKQSYLSETGLPWPWMVIAGGIAFLGISLVGVSAQFATHKAWSAGSTAIVVALVLVFAVRDVLFLQWCLLTRMKNPIVKGIGLLWLYYFAASIASSVFLPYPNRTATSMYLLTPAGAFISDVRLDNLIGGMVLQAIACGFILYLINQRLTEMQTKTAAAAA
jgi:hypothetical protein